MRRCHLLTTLLSVSTYLSMTQHYAVLYDTYTHMDVCRLEAVPMERAEAGQHIYRLSSTAHWACE